MTLDNEAMAFPVACEACNLGQAPEEIRTALAGNLLVDWHRRAWESGSNGAAAERFVDQNIEVRREIGMNGSDGPFRAKPGEERFVIIRTGIYLPDHEKKQQEFWNLPSIC